MYTQNNNLFTQEEQRLEADFKHKEYWRRWGPYLSERQWGTVREDYSEDGSTWDYFSHEQSHYRPDRCEEDGNGTDSERLLAIVSPERLKIILQKMLHENEFCSD